MDRLVPADDALPMRAAAVTPRWLESVLRLAPGTVTGVQVLVDDHGTSSRARLAVETTDGSLPPTLFVKFTPPDVPQRVFMNIMELGRREVLFYDAIAGQVPVRVPHCHAALINPRRARNVMLLEDLADRARFRDLREPCTAPEAAAVVEAMADYHAAYWDSPRFATDLRALGPRTAPVTYLTRVVVGRMVTQPRGRVAELIPPEVQAASRVLVERQDAIEAFWAGAPRTLMHGDPHLGNLFFEGERPGFLDWQTVMAGPGIRDVAYFVTASLDIPLARACERELIDRYAARLATRGVAADPAQVWTHYRAAIAEIYTAVVVTAGTSERMQPFAVSRAGVERAVAAVQEHDTFAVLDALASGRTV